MNMKKLNLIIIHPLFVSISFFALYIIGLSNNFFLGLKNMHIHFIYLFLISICLGFIGGLFFVKAFKNDRYANFKKVFKDENESLDTLNYLNKLIYFLDSNYFKFILNFNLCIYFLISTVAILNGINLDSNIFNYIFICFYFSICLSVIFLYTFDYVLKTEIKEDIGIDVFDSYISNFSLYEFNNYNVSSIIFSFASIIIIIIFILKHYQLF